MFSTCAFLFMWLVGHLLLYFQVALDVYCFCRLDSPSGRGFLLFLSRLVGYIVDAKCLFLVVVQWLSLVWFFAIPWTTAHQASLSFIISWSCSNSCPLSQWCHLTISSSFIPFSSCLQSFPASRSFPVSWLFTSGVQSTGASASVLPMNVS